MEVKARISSCRRDACSVDSDMSVVPVVICYPSVCDAVAVAVDEDG